MEAHSIELFDDKAKCPSCGYEFTARFILKNKNQDTCEIKCPNCSHKYFTMIRSELFNQLDETPIEVGEEIDHKKLEGELDEVISEYYLENDPRYCGKCKRVLDRYSDCPKCHVSPKEFSLRDKKVPGGIKFFQYVFLFLGILAITALISGIVMSQVFDFRMFFMAIFTLGAYISFKISSRAMSSLGLISCNYCGAPLSPNSVFCIYCGHRVPHSLTKGNKIGIAIAFSLVGILIAGLVITVPPELKIDNVSYVRPSTSDTELEITVTLTNELRKIAEKEDILILFDMRDQINKFVWGGDDVDYKSKESCTYNVPLPEYQGGYIILMVEVYHVGQNRITGERVENWEDSEFVAIYYR
jgi:DNA-directed RNA polymerase subunit RPC12/RpoP